MCTCFLGPITEPSGNFISRQAMLFEYESRDLKAISHAPLSRDTLFFLHSTCSFSAKNVWNDLKFLGRMDKIPFQPLRSFKQFK